MSTLKASLVALALIAGVSGSAQAQGFAGIGSGGFVTYPNSGFVNSGYSGIGYGGYNGYSYGGYNGLYMPGYIPSGTYNNMGGIMGSIRTQTGRPGSYNNGNNFGVSRTRRGR